MALLIETLYSGIRFPNNTQGVGKQADLILADLSALNLSPVLEAPVHIILPNLVYAACAASRAQRGSGHMVAGKVLVHDGAALAVSTVDKSRPVCYNSTII